MNILLANSTCKVGGVSTFMLNLRSALLGLGHGCELFFFERGTMEPLLPGDARVHFGTLADCMRLVARERVDVVHANNVDWSTGISAVRQAGARLILTAHKARESAWTYGWTSANCDALTTVSRWIRHDLQPYTDLPIQVVPNGVDTERFTTGPGAASDRPIVCWIGRGTSPLKGLDIFAAAAPALHRAGFRLWVMDQHGPARFAELHPEAADTLRPLAERWEGVPIEAMPQLYRDVAASHGCLLSTSRSEGLPLALLEAQACGCIVIASGIRGNNECVSAAHGGRLFPLDLAPERLAALAIETLADPQRVAAAQRAAAAYVRERFSRDRMAAEYLRLYREAPLPSTIPLGARARARMRLSPLLHWRTYLEQRWGVGHRQYLASAELLEQGDAGLAAGAARESLRTSPTLYLKPQRLAHLVAAARATRPGASTS